MDGRPARAAATGRVKVALSQPHFVVLFLSHTQKMGRGQIIMILPETTPLCQMPPLQYA